MLAERRLVGSHRLAKAYDECVAQRAEPKPAVSRPGALRVSCPEEDRFTRQLEKEASLKTGDQLNSNPQLGLNK